MSRLSLCKGGLRSSVVGRQRVVVGRYLFVAVRWVLPSGMNAGTAGAVSVKTVDWKVMP